MKHFFILIFIINFQSLWAGEIKQLSFLFLGQSNMAGQGQIRELPQHLRLQPNNIHFFLNGSTAQLTRQQKFGPEVSFARQVSLIYPDTQINLIKFAPGGSLMKDWLAGGAHYIKLKKQLGRISKQTSIKPAGILWAQGERDTKSLQSAKSYEHKLERFIHTIRHDLGKQNLPFMIAETSIPAAYRPGVIEVRKAQRKLSNKLSNVYVFKTDSLSKKKDNVHFDTQGQIALGSLFARYFMPKRSLLTRPHPETIL